MTDPQPNSEMPVTPAAPVKTTAAPGAPTPPKDIDYGNVPLSEEFDKAKWTLPPVGIVLAGIAIVLVVGAVLGWFNRYIPVASGQIREVFAVEGSDKASVLTTVLVSVRNDTEKPIFIKNLNAKLDTADGKSYDDTAANEVDYERYFQAFPDLRAHAIAAALKPETKIAPGQQVSGTLVFGFPVPKADFDSRKNLSVTVEPYDQRAIVVAEKEQKK